MARHALIFTRGMLRIIPYIAYHSLASYDVTHDQRTNSISSCVFFMAGVQEGAVH